MRLVKERVFSDILNILPYPIYVCILPIYVFSQYVYCVLRPEWRALSTELQRSGARRSGGVLALWSRSPTLQTLSAAHSAKLFNIFSIKN